MTAKAARRLNRILAMLPWVIERGGATVDEVCERFGYTRKELLGDLELVFVCGLPGYGPGDLMVAYVDENDVVIEMADYFGQPLRLTPREALALLASGMALTSTGQAPPALESAVRKLQAVVVPDAEAVTIDVADTEVEPELVATLRRAVAEHRVVEIEYVALSSGKTTVRAVEPWRVFAALGNWYLRGWCRHAAGERVFRVDRIRDARLGDETFVPPADLPEPVVRYTPNEGDVVAEIQLGPRARWVAEYYPVEVVADDGESLTIRFSAADPAVVARLLTRLGSEAKLVSGDEVAAATDDLRARILARYEA